MPGQRGYTGFYPDTPMPVACKCVFPKESWDAYKDHIPNTRRNQDRFVKLNQLYMKKPKNNLIKRMNLNQVGKDLYKNKNGKFFTWDGKTFVKKAD